MFKSTYLILWVCICVLCSLINEKPIPPSDWPVFHLLQISYSHPSPIFSCVRHSLVYAYVVRGLFLSHSTIPIDIDLDVGTWHRTGWYKNPCLFVTILKYIIRYRVSHKRRPIAKILKVEILNYFNFLT